MVASKESVKERTSRLNSALKAQEAAQKEAERQKVQREIDLKAANESEEQIAGEAADAATQAVQEHHRSTLRRLQKEKAAMDKQVEQTRNAAAAESAQLISSIDELLAEATCAAEEVERSKLEARLTEARARVTESEGLLSNPSLMGMCRRELSPQDLQEVEALPYNINAFAAADGVSSLDQRRKSALGKVVNKLLESALTKAHPTDQAGVFAAARARREAANTVDGAAVASTVSASCRGNSAGEDKSGFRGGSVGLGRQEPEAPSAVSLLAYINAAKAGDKRTAKQQLSILVSVDGMTEDRSIELCSKRTPLVIGNEVHVSLPGNLTKKGVLEELRVSSSSGSGGGASRSESANSHDRYCSSGGKTASNSSSSSIGNCSGTSSWCRSSSNSRSSDGGNAANRNQGSSSGGGGGYQCIGNSRSSSCSGGGGGGANWSQGSSNSNSGRSSESDSSSCGSGNCSSNGGSHGGGSSSRRSGGGGCCAAKVSGFGEVIDTRRVLNRGDVICTQHQVHQAKMHAKEKFLGACVEAFINTHCGIEPPRAEFVAKFLRDATVVEPVEARDDEADDEALDGTASGTARSSSGSLFSVEDDSKYLTS